MRRVIIKEYGGPDVLTTETVEDEHRLEPGQVLVDVEAAGVNYLDVMQREGVIKLPLPYSKRCCSRL
jgi:NADPH:quinone reductase